MAAPHGGLWPFTCDRPWNSGGRRVVLCERNGTVPLSPELTEGPYYIEIERIRRDITEGRPGVPLQLRVLVLDEITGAPVPGAAVDIWHCDAQGVYSGFSGPGPGRGLGGPGGHEEFFEIVEENDLPHRRSLRTIA